MLHFQNIQPSRRTINRVYYNTQQISSIDYLQQLINTHIWSRIKYHAPPPPPVKQLHESSCQVTGPSSPTADYSPSQLSDAIHRNQMESKYLTNIAKYSPVYHGSQIQTSIWPQLPLARRASVMVLLFLGKMGELRVILTRRSKKLRAFSGHISLPGGKADTLDESEWDVARRETEEEIGISADDDYLKSHSGFTIHKINTLPAYLSRTFLGVRPCVGFIDFHHASNKAISSILLNPGESSAIFSVPLKDFLQPKPRRYELKECLKQSYIKTKWGGIPWNLRSFIFPIHNPHEVPWLESIQDLSSEEDETEQDMEFGEKTRNVWGLTANILRDLAMLTYGGSKHFHELVGEEDLIHSLATVGKQMQGRPRSEFEKTMTNNRRGVGFDQVLPEHEVQRLKTLYSVI